MQKNLSDSPLSRQTKIFVYSENRFFPKNPVFLKILCPKIYRTLLISHFCQYEKALYRKLVSDNLCDCHDWCSKNPDGFENPQGFML